MGSTAAANSSVPSVDGSPSPPALPSNNAEPERLFTCSICFRQFNKKANLKVHSRKHTGEKPYACSKPGCGRTFMWKSSVTFHEQNCQAGKKETAPSPSTPQTSKGVQKRPKASKGSRSSAAQAAGQAAVVGSNVKIPKSKSPSQSKSSLKTPPVSNESLKVDNTDDAQVWKSSHLMAQPDSIDAQASMSPGDSNLLAMKTTSEVTQEPSPEKVDKYNDVTDTSSAASAPSPQSLLMSGTGNMAQDASLGGFAVSSAGLPSQDAMASSSGSNACNTPGGSTSASGHTAPGLPEGTQLPAPSTLLLDKRLQMGGGRPPIIPGSFPKHFYSIQAPHKEGNNTGTKSIFDLRVPSAAQGASGAKPPVMFSSKSKMPKMPIAMDLDDSDDEGGVKIVGAQDAFIRTGNPFGGFAPRCSPLPVSSPIVCPGISPMPLSPLAPFSPLPPDSPAHNAPDPVHPPLNQPVVRPINTNW